jgi:tRNA threonylcarbamoyladenosine biosynthesis protein TsaE
MTREFQTQAAEETIALGAELLPLLKNAHLVLLRGDLGTGKTTLVKGIAEAFGAAERDDVNSPTFTLVHEYRGPQNCIFHIDLYRIETERELATLGIEDLLHEDGSLLLVEWGEKFPRLTRDRDVEIAIERIGPDARKFVVNAK